MPKNRVALRIDTKPSIETPPAPTDIEESLVPPAIPSIPEPDGLVLTTVVGRSAVTPTAIITADWDQPRGTEPQSYAVQYSTVSNFATGSQTTVVNTSNNETSATLENLRTNTTYYVRVAAIFRSVQSGWSDAASITTPNDLTPPGPVTGATAVFTTAAIGNGDLLIRWTNPTSANFKDVIIDIYKSNGGTLLGSFDSRTGRYLYIAGRNIDDDGSTGDPSLYVVLTARSYNNVLSTTVALSPVKAAPANVAAPTVDFSGRDLIISWPAAVGANNYRLTLNSTRTYEVPNRTYTYTFAENVAQNTTPDPTISYSIVAVDAFEQTSVSPRTGTATNGAPAAPTAVSVTGYFSTMAIVVTATEPDDFLYYRYRIIQTNPSAASVTFNSTTALRVYSIDAAATYQVGVRVVDAFNQTSSETLSAAVVIDTLTLEDLREDAKYSNIDGTSNAVLKAALADNSFVTNGVSTSVAQGTWAWWRFERPYLERYETITFMSNFNTSLDWYIRTSSNGTTWEYFSGPVTGSRVLTAVASEAAARTAAVNILTLGNTAATSRVELPSIKQARYVELWTRVDVGSTGLHAVREYYPRRLVQSDDIEAESIRGINISGATITGDRLVANTITATQIAANTITATQIAANTITATEIAASTITATQIAANAITATQIAANAITTAKIAADAVTADKISVTTLSAITANLGTITAGIITGATIQTATSGARIELTSANGLRSFNSAGTLQTQIRTDNGRLTWGGGAAFLDASGVQLSLPTSGGTPALGALPSGIYWENSNHEALIAGTSTGATGVHRLYIANTPLSNAASDIFIRSWTDQDVLVNPKNMSVTLEAAHGATISATIQVMATFSGLDQIYLTGDVYDGISFGNTSANASKLDYYQEGTWTVTIVGTTTTGAATYPTSLGRYVRVGKYVFVTCEVEWTGGTGAGNLRIRGLPFTVLSTGVFSSASIYSSNVASPAGTVLQGGFLNNSVDIFLASVPTGGGAAAALAYDAAGGLWVSGWYEV
jgi:hypothetical protein